MSGYTLETCSDWVSGAIDAGERGLADYGVALDVMLEDLRGRILDIGSSKTQRFAHECAALYACLQIPGPTIVSVSPDMKHREWREELIVSPGFEHKTVAAVGSELPFPDNTFRSVLSLGALTMYAGFEGSVRAKPAVVTGWMSEILRVLEPGGMARIGGMYLPETHDQYRDAFGEVERPGTLAIEPCYYPGNVPIMTTAREPQHMHRLVIQKPHV